MQQAMLSSSSILLVAEASYLLPMSLLCYLHACWVICGHCAICVVIVPFTCLSGHPCGRWVIHVIVVLSMWSLCHPCGHCAIHVVVVPSRRAGGVQACSGRM